MKQLILIVAFLFGCEKENASWDLKDCTRLCKTDACVEACFNVYRERRKTFEE